jgi:hypothetical protein
VANVTPNEMPAEAHRKMAEPGIGRQNTSEGGARATAVLQPTGRCGRPRPTRFADGSSIELHRDPLRVVQFHVRSRALTEHHEVDLQRPPWRQAESSPLHRNTSRPGFPLHRAGDPRATVRGARAVLPFANLNRDPEKDYFADGVTHALITELARIPAVRVISRQSVLHLTGSSRTLEEIARELRVDAVVGRIGLA